MTQQAQKSDEHFMQQALRLGRYGLGNTAPNPAVGCVLVSAEGHVVGTGFTGQGGRPHAEAVALAEVTALVQQLRQARSQLEDRVGTLRAEAPRLGR